MPNYDLSKICSMQAIFRMGIPIPGWAPSEHPLTRPIPNTRRPETNDTSDESELSSDEDSYSDSDYELESSDEDSDFE